MTLGPQNHETWRFWTPPKYGLQPLKMKVVGSHGMVGCLPHNHLKLDINHLTLDIYHLKLDMV